MLLEIYLQFIIIVLIVQNTSYKLWALHDINVISHTLEIYLQFSRIKIQVKD